MAMTAESASKPLDESPLSDDMEAYLFPLRCVGQIGR